MNKRQWKKLVKKKVAEMRARRPYCTVLSVPGYGSVRIYSDRRPTDANPSRPE